MEQPTNPLTMSDIIRLRDYARGAQIEPCVVKNEKMARKMFRETGRRWEVGEQFYTYYSKDGRDYIEARDNAATCADTAQKAE